jgi:hypothetical protein
MPSLPKIDLTAERAPVVGIFIVIVGGWFYHEIYVHISLIHSDWDFNEMDSGIAAL